jgi:predicted nucleotidyltransferase
MHGVTPSISPVRIAALERVAAGTPALELLLLFGSRARADAHPRSDWDFGYLASDRFDPAALLGALVEAVGSDRVDLVDLRRAGGLLRYRAARDGRLVYEARPRQAERFCLEAAQFWCDAGPVLQRGYEEVLAELER